jgi:hypothetical protein
MFRGIINVLINDKNINKPMNSKELHYLYICEYCKNQFTKTDLRTYKYCSRNCYHESRIGLTRKSSNKTKLEKKLILHNCDWCNKEFSSASSAGAKSVYCSRSCQGFAFSSKNKKMNPISDVDASYIAAMIDGEGTISIIDRKHNRPNSSRPTIRISISNSYKPLIDWLIDITGLGSIHNEKNIEGRKQMYKWAVHSYSALLILERITCFLKEKRYLAENAINHLTHENRSLD